MSDEGSGAAEGLWGAVVGQPAATRILRRAVAAGEVPHAWLLVGPASVGQRQAAEALAADLNCPDSEPHACGRCSTCRRIAEGRHPASIHLEPEGAWHVVEAVREEWIATATRTLAEGRRRVLRIVAADRMNEGAQNAFLKVLEEPPASVVWVLEAEDDSALLDTVVSRCRRVDFVPWAPSALEARAEALGVPAGRRADLVRAAMGSPERLEMLAGELAAHDEDANGQLGRDRHLDIVRRLAEEGPGIAVPLAKELVGWAARQQQLAKAAHQEELARLEESFAESWPPGVKGRIQKRFERLEREARHAALRSLLDDLASWLRDLLAVHSGLDADAAVNADHADALRRDVRVVPPSVALDGLQGISECAEALEANGQPELQLERLLLRLGVGIYRVTDPSMAGQPR